MGLRFRATPLESVIPSYITFNHSPSLNAHQPYLQRSRHLVGQDGVSNLVVACDHPRLRHSVAPIDDGAGRACSDVVRSYARACDLIVGTRSLLLGPHHVVAVDQRAQDESCSHLAALAAEGVVELERALRWALWGLIIRYP